MISAKGKIWIVLLVFCVFFVSSRGYMIGNNPTYRAEWLDTQGLYYMEWRFDWNQKVITFNITAGTTGYVMFGLANNGSTTTGADIVVGGLDSRGEAYFSDKYTLDNDVIRDDKRQNYVFHSVWENQTHTILSFSRLFDTCDNLDYPITDNRVTVLWGYGPTDDFDGSREYGVRGSSSVHLLDPEYSPRISRDRRFRGAPTIVTPDNQQVWTIRREIVIPENDTAYLCSIHKAPVRRKHHVVGMDLYFHSQGSRRRTHHFLMYKCKLPGGADPRPVFEPFNNGVSQTCYIPRLPPDTGIPTHFCAELYAGWASGGRSFFTPPHVGFPLGEEDDEYYLLQVHYDNPERQSGVTVDMRLDFFYTSQLRKYDGGMLGQGHTTPGLPTSILLPPNTSSERILSHCPGECTERMLPPSGINIFAAMLHSHYSGRNIRIRHFRKNRELPWVLYDDNYSNNFQQIRHLREEVSVRPGDQLTTECIMTSTWTNGSVVGGFPTSQDMCISFIFYYGRISDYSYCYSEIVSPEYRQKFLGVRNVTWNEEELEWVATAPKRLAGLTMKEISDNYVDWNGAKREDLKRYHETHPHIVDCSRVLSYRDARQGAETTATGTRVPIENVPTYVNTQDVYRGPATYPFKAQPYVPERTCSFERRG